MEGEKKQDMWNMKDCFNGLSYIKEWCGFSQWGDWLDAVPYLSQATVGLCGSVEAEK